MHYSIPLIGLKSVVHEAKLQCILQELMFYNSSIFNAPFNR